MWRITKEFTFEAAHYLPSHDGKCRRPHGHSFRGQLILEGDSLVKDGPKVGMLMDYYDISQVIKPILEDYLDHHDLNQTTGLENPTSEEIARWIYQKVKGSLPQLISVKVFETCTSAAEYSE